MNTDKLMFEDAGLGETSEHLNTQTFSYDKTAYTNDSQTVTKPNIQTGNRANRTDTSAAADIWSWLTSGTSGNQ